MPSNIIGVSTYYVVYLLDYREFLVLIFAYRLITTLNININIVTYFRFLFKTFQMKIVNVINLC